MQTYILIFILFSFLTPSLCLPLSTKSRWIVDDRTGQRVKLAGGNWAGHVGPMLPEGLDKRPLSEIARHISLMGFNSVRLTYATHMFTRHAKVTVAESFGNLGLKKSMVGLRKHNPHLLNLTLPEAQMAVVDELGAHGVMVLLDCQVSKPMWCCSEEDGNGFWGDKYFDPEDWVHALRKVAAFYKDTPTVFAMSLRNEIRGPRQNFDDWYRYVRMGANTIHKTNPNVLVLISGLSYDLDFSALKYKPLGLKFTHKIVYEAHRYSFTNGQAQKYLNQSLNQFCDSVKASMYNMSTFLISGTHPSPLYITEFGVDLMGTHPTDNVFLGCFLTYLAENDLDWNLWALQGSYYDREGRHELEEEFGMFTKNWTKIRSPETLEKLLSVQKIIHDPNSFAPQFLRMYHPLTGRCIKVDDKNEIRASDCYSLTKWSHNGPIRMVGTPYCLTAVGEGLPVILTRDCYSEDSMWKRVSNYQLANKDNLCLHYDPSYSPKVLTRKCICPRSDDPTCIKNPQSQWFSLLLSNTF